MINLKNSEDMKAIANYCNELPPTKDINFKNFWKDVPSHAQDNIKDFWIALGLTLDAFATGESNPIPSWSLSPEMSDYLQKHATFYNVLSVVIFESEHLIKKEAKARGLNNLLNLKRSDFVKIWMIEDCFETAWQYSQEFWEGVSVRALNDRLRDYKRILSGEYSESRGEKILQKIDIEDSKLHRDKLEIESFKSFCLDVFSKYQKNITGLRALETVISSPPSYTRKAGLKKGDTVYYPGRGKNKNP